MRPGQPRSGQPLQGADPVQHQGELLAAAGGLDGPDCVAAFAVDDKREVWSLENSASAAILRQGQLP